ncbi:MAG TPA: Gfo/Idh/MocA family oxidoreductase [Candidatus Brocadiia bacterium]|nr:Gfo/Idh/MocA family oxidoreductase [Candidatus Brocadiia bacterium]
MTKGTTRRRFIKGAAAALGAGFAHSFTARSYARIIGSNEDIRVAVAGCRSQGASHMQTYLGMKGARLVKICDADSAVLGTRLAEARGKDPSVEGEADVRRVIEDAGIDAIVAATPNHWHALLVVWACQAGKHIYVEKPVTHCIWEGRRIIEAARKYNRVVQCGMQRRSDPCWPAAFEWIREGHLGKMLYSRGLCYVRRDSIGKVSGPQEIPKSVDYNLWSGPREMKPLMRRNLHYDWHWAWLTGNGDLGNNGVHQADIAAWSIGASELAPACVSVGGRFGYDDDGETPNTQICIFDYKPVPVISEVRGLPLEQGGEALPQFLNCRVNNIIHCEGGYIMGGSAYEYEEKGTALGRKATRIRSFGESGGSGHRENFIEAVRAGKQSVANAPPVTGHVAAGLCHQANISHRIGRMATPDEIEESLKYDSGALETFERFREHLGRNGVDLRTDRAVLGPRLKFDPKMERFVGNGALDERANALLKDDYREPFVIPEEV